MFPYRGLYPFFAASDKKSMPFYTSKDPLLLPDKLWILAGLKEEEYPQMTNAIRASKGICLNYRSCGTGI